MTPTHPDACASCGCIRRHAHWCRAVVRPLPRLDRDEAREIADHDGEAEASFRDFLAGHGMAS